MSREKDFKAKFKSGAEVLQSLFESQKGPVSDQFLRWKLWLSWSEIVGPTISEISEPVAYHHGVLWLWTKNSVQMQHLTFLISEIQTAVNTKYRPGFAKEIRLTLDRRTIPASTDQGFKNNVRKWVK